MSLLTPAIDDLADAMRRFPLWVALGTIEIKQRYQRSFFGPFWITINIGALIFGIGFIYANVFDSIRSSYIPFLAAGIVTWNFVNSALGEGASAFIDSGAIIRNVTISKHVHLLHCLWRNLIIFGHNVLIMIPVYIIYDAFPGWGILSVIPGVIILVLFLFAASLFLAVVSARYRDVPPAIIGLLQIAFFATPIIWEAKSLSSHRWIVDFNPVFHLIECVRAPLLYGTTPLLSFAVVLGLALVSGLVALVVYSKAERRIVFWL